MNWNPNKLKEPALGKGRRVYTEVTPGAKALGWEQAWDFPGTERMCACMGSRGGVPECESREAVRGQARPGQVLKARVQN